MFALACTLVMILAPVSLNETQGVPWFPPRTFSEDEEVDQARAELLAEYLRAAGEDSLVENSQYDQVYRLVWVPPFEEAIIVGILHDGESSSISSAIFSDPRIREAPIVSSQPLSTSQWGEFSHVLETSGFWTTFSNRPDEADTIVMDSPYWLLEGCSAAAYKVVQRSPPIIGRDEEFLRVAYTLLRLAGFDVTDLGLEGLGGGTPQPTDSNFDEELIELPLLKIALDCHRFAGKRVSVVGAVVLEIENRRICPTEEFLLSDPLNCLWLRLAPPFDVEALRMATEVADDGDYIYIEGAVSCYDRTSDGEYGGILEEISRIISFKSGAVLWESR